MAGPVLFIYKPIVQDLPPDQHPDALAWFGRFASGHLAHLDQKLTAWCTANGLALENVTMSWGEYQRLLKESHWYENI